MIRVFPDTGQLVLAAAELFVERSALAVRNRGRFRVALSGGSTPRPVYQLLSTPPFRERVSWPAVHVFWGDERFVPPGDDRSNARLAAEALLDHVPVLPGNVHPITGQDGAEAAAKEYEAILRREFEEGAPRFDLILLGLGSDGHTASLFPGSTDLGESRRWVATVRRDEEAFPRITLTVGAINHAELICFLVAGSEKAHAVSAALGDVDEAPQSPATRISPVQGTVHWYIDRAAAASRRS